MPFALLASSELFRHLENAIKDLRVHFSLGRNVTTVSAMTSVTVSDT